MNTKKDTSMQQVDHHVHKHSAGGPSEVLTEVYDADFLNVVFIPSSRLVHTPPKSMGVTRLVLCRNFDDGMPDASCSKGSSCKFVHANIEGCKKHPIHVNYAWRSLDLVTYPRLPAGDIVQVLAPNDRPPIDELPSDHLLVTRGSTARREGGGGAGSGGSKLPTVSHCAHYYFNRMCNRGERCNFIHAVHLDPNASAWQRAPAPTAVAPLHRGQKAVPAAPQQQQQQQSQQSLTVTEGNTIPEDDREALARLVQQVQIAAASPNSAVSTGEQGLAVAPSVPSVSIQQQAPMMMVMAHPQPFTHQQMGPAAGGGPVVPAHPQQIFYQPVYMPMVMPAVQGQVFPQQFTQHQQQFVQQPQQFAQQPHQQFMQQPQQFVQAQQFPQQQFVQQQQQFVQQQQQQPMPSMTSFFAVPSAPMGPQGGYEDASVGGRSSLLGWSHHGALFNNGSLSGSMSSVSSTWK